MPKKRAKKLYPKQLLLPMFALSLVAGIGLTLFQNRATSTPIQIAEIGQNGNCAQVAFTDNFAGNTINSAKWLAYSATGGTATQADKLTLFQPAGATTSLGESNFLSEGKVELEGDFVQEVTLNSLSTLPDTSNYSSFLLGFASVGWKNWYRIEIYKNGDIQTYSNTNDVVTSKTPVNAYKNTPTKLKLIRSDSTLTSYYDVGAGYILHSTVPNIYTGKVFLQIDLLSHAPEKPAATAIVKDFSLKCRPPMPTGLTHSCSSDGKKVTFIWDDNSPSKKYHFGLDDVKESDEDWFKPGTTDVWRGGDYTSNTYELPVIPGREYKWWVNTNIDYTSKSETVSKTITCNPKPPAPTNLRHTCNPDGKSVRLMWDGIADADYYKLRVDDKKGNVNSIDGITGKTEYIATIKPGETYSWWAHSTKSNIDSLETERKDFKCTATSTPTPTSTPKPTVKDTAKPTFTPAEPSPTSTPKISPTSTPRMSPTNPSYSPPSNANTLDDNPAKVVSKNPIARFFSWLASLFE